MSEGSSPSLNMILQGHMPITSNQALLERITEIRERACVAMVLAPGLQLSRDMIPPLLDVVADLEVGVPCDLFLLNLGEATPEVWRLVSLLRGRFGGFDALVPFAASSAATQVSVAADRIMMTDAASLSPFGGTATVTRAIMVAMERCLKVGSAGTASDGRALETLRGLSSDFPLTRPDCTDVLGLDAPRMSEPLAASTWALCKYYREMLSLEGDLKHEGHHYTLGYDGFIDTAKGRRVLLSISRLDEDGQPLPGGPSRRWIQPINQDVVVDEELQL